MDPDQRALSRRHFGRYQIFGECLRLGRYRKPDRPVRGGDALRLEKPQIVIDQMRRPGERLPGGRLDRARQQPASPVRGVSDPAARPGPAGEQCRAEAVRKQPEGVRAPKLSAESQSPSGARRAVDRIQPGKYLQYPRRPGPRHGFDPILREGGAEGGEEGGRHRAVSDPVRRKDDLPPRLHLRVVRHPVPPPPGKGGFFVSFSIPPPGAGCNATNHRGR